MKRKFDLACLNSARERDGFKVRVLPLHLNRDTVIMGTCKCGIDFEKILRLIVDNGGGFCKSCVDRVKNIIS